MDHCLWNKVIFPLTLDFIEKKAWNQNRENVETSAFLLKKKRISRLSKCLLFYRVTSLVSAILTDQFMVATYTDKPRVDYVYFCKRPPLGEATKKIEKLSVWEPKVSCLRICMYLVVNAKGFYLLLYSIKLYYSLN